MSCEDVRPRLTGYLDGELDADRGSVVRGHLRECAACRQVATDEAALRDGLRQLPHVDPPPSLWAGVQARLAEAEVADARRPAWRRALTRWLPSAPRFAAGTLVAATAVGVLWWRSQRGPDGDVATQPEPTAIATAPTTPRMSQTHVVVASDRGEPDVTADLAGEAGRVTASYGDAAEELLALAGEVRGQWTEEQRTAFDARVAELRGTIASAADGHPRQRAWRDLIRYLQNAVVRDEIAFAGGGQ
ncbi:MAG: superfamily protein [Myxococcales bacterium]|nr:superfamily protein [Myxococcales bacterium]